MNTTQLTFVNESGNQREEKISARSCVHGADAKGNSRKGTFLLGRFRSDLFQISRANRKRIALPISESVDT